MLETEKQRSLVITALLIMLMIMGTFGIVQSEEREMRETAKGITEFSKDYSKMKLDELAEKYSVETKYLYYLVEVEHTFQLEPYELMALIARESEFKPHTHMDGGSLSYNTTQMKLPTAKTAYMAITEYYNIDLAYPTHELLEGDEYYAAFLAGGYLKYLHDVYQDKYEAYTAYRWGINGRMNYYKQYGHFQSPYALAIAQLNQNFASTASVN